MNPPAWLYWGEVGPDRRQRPVSDTRVPKVTTNGTRARTAGNLRLALFSSPNNKTLRRPTISPPGIFRRSLRSQCARQTLRQTTTGPHQIFRPLAPAWLLVSLRQLSSSFPELKRDRRNAPPWAGPVYHYRTNVVKATKLPCLLRPNPPHLGMVPRLHSKKKSEKIDDDGSPAQNQSLPLQLPIQSPHRYENRARWCHLI